MAEKSTIVYLSQHQITMGDVVLLPFSVWPIPDAPTYPLSFITKKIGPTLTPIFNIQKEKLVEAAGQITIERGNRGHVISFTLFRLWSTFWEANMDVFNFVQAIPQGGQDVTIKVKGSEVVKTLKAASVSACPAENDDVVFSQFTITIEGGALTGPVFAFDPLRDPTGDIITDPSGDPITAPP